eukprot:1517297-Rhodomonas_salina.1
MPVWLPITGAVMAGEKLVSKLLAHLDEEESSDRSILACFPQNGIECKLCMHEVSRDQLSLRLCASSSFRVASE